MTSSTLRGRFLQLTMAFALLASVATAQSLTTTFLSNNGLAGNMFDVSTVGAAVIINDMDVNLDPGSWTVDVWAVTGGGSFVPVHTDVTQWTLIGSATVTSSGLNLATNLGLSMGHLVAPASTVGFYVTTTTGSGINYTNGVNGGGVYASDSFLNIHEGIGKGLSGYPATFSATVGGGTLPPSASSRIFNGTIYYVPQSGLTDDLAMTSITAPVDSTGCSLLTSTETVSATFTNFGSTTVPMGTLVQIDLIVDGGATITEFANLPADLALGQSHTHTFAATANCAAPGAHSIDVTVGLLGDLDASNDNAVIMVNSGNPFSITSFPWSENFDGAAAQNSTIPPAGWEQDAADAVGTDSDWYMHTGTTTSTNTGPNGDNTSGSGYYAYVEDGGGNHAQVNLITPCLDLSGLTAPLCNFFYFSHNANPGGPNTQENFLSVDVIAYPGGVVTMDAFGPAGDQGSATWAAATWSQQAVNLAPFAGQTVQLRFRGSNDNSGAGNTFYHDLAIDDVSVFEPVVTNGQAPRPNLAVMDIENATNANLAGVGSGLNGPYYAGVTQGSSFSFTFQGAPTQAITVVYGALNPVSATYPGGIGQFDIGGPGVDGMGFPLNIAVFVDAIGWAQGGFNGFPLDALFFTDLAGDCNVGFTMPNFGIPMGSTLTTFQSAITSSAAPFVYISNAIEVSIN